MANDRVMSIIGLAMKANKVVSGEFAVDNQVKSGKASLVIVAGDASDNTKKSNEDMCRFYNVPLRYYKTKEELGRGIGKEYRAVVAIIDEGFSKLVLEALG